MKNRFYRGLWICSLFLLCSAAVYSQNQDIPKNLVVFAEEVLMPFGNNEGIVGGILRQNGQNLSLDEIKRRDEIWLQTGGINRFMLDLLSNDTALILLNLESEYSFIVETFVMDNQGALVGLTSKTSDYWQGDEAKFNEPFTSGAVHYGDVEYDASVDEIMIQVSIPVMQQNQPIGAITFGVSLDRWERR